MARKFTVDAYITVDLSHGITISMDEIIRPAQFSEFTTLREIYQAFQANLADNEKLNKIVMEAVEL